MKMAPSKDKAVAATAAAAAVARPQEAVHKCPRCDSANTKFCYYNNYSLTQPRHFCKTCRRYWTKGGALRNVPVGGGCRKNKRSRASSSSSSATSSKEGSLSATDIGGLKFFQNFTPAMDYNLAGLNSPKPSGGLFGATTQISSFMDISSSPGSGLNFPFPQLMNKQMGPPPQQMGPPPPPPQIPSLASSIESLSYINQDLHWKLQQQRLTLLFGGGATTTAAVDQNQQNPIAPSPQPLMFHNLEIAAGDPKPDDHQIPNEDENFLSARNGSSLSTEWFFDSSYPPVNPNPTATSNSNINWSGMPGWSPYSGI